MCARVTTTTIYIGAFEIIRVIRITFHFAQKKKRRVRKKEKNTLLRTLRGNIYSYRDYMECR